jgi:hypothetical protein
LIQVELSSTEIAIEPGGTAQLSVTVKNNQTHDDHVFLEIEGIDVEWYALPVPTVNVAAGTSQTARVLFRIARESGSFAGTYPFVVRARSMETGDSGVQQASLVVKPYSSLQVEINPKRAIATFLHHANVVEVTVTNLSNHEETLDLYASDPEDACAYDFEKDRITLKPGHSETVPVRIEPVNRPILGSTRLYGYTITARSVTDSFVSASANGQLERHALLSIVALAILVIIALGTAAFFMFRPHPAVINSFNVSPRQIVAGESVTVSWDVSNANEGIFILPENIRKSTPAGSMKIALDTTTTFTLIARYGGGKEIKQSVTAVVTPAPIPAKPKIVSFTGSQKRVHEGETVTLSWNVEGVKTIVLNPLGVQKEWPLYTSQEVKPETTTTYVLAAQGPGGTVNKSVTVEVVPVTQSIALINGFKAKPEKVVAGQKASLSWSVDNAVSIEIDNGVGASLKPKGKVEVTPQNTTIYTLRATDNKGNITSKTVTLTVTPPEPPPVNPDGTGAPGGDTTKPPSSGTTTTPGNTL